MPDKSDNIASIDTDLLRGLGHWLEILADPVAAKARLDAVMEATDAQTSHMPHTYEKREGYNQNGQPRDYSTNTQAQTGVESRASSIPPGRPATRTGSLCQHG